jgi:heme exporter protein A
MILRLRQVARFYGHRLIFKDVSLDVPAGSVTLLAGANGAGKSTLMRIMAGLIRPSAGEVLPGDDDCPSPTIGYLGHQTFLYPELTAWENLRFWSAMNGVSPADTDIAAILERVELAPFAHERSRGFSRGMAQRLNLARVFLLRPDLLLLDEPGTGLDTRSTGVLHREIAAARASGAAIVWITHNLADDLRRADHAAVLGKKSLAFSGTATDCRRWMAEDQPAAAPYDPGFATPVEASGGALC